MVGSERFWFAMKVFCFDVRTNQRCDIQVGKLCGSAAIESFVFAAILRACNAHGIYPAYYKTRNCSSYSLFQLFEKPIDSFVEPACLLLHFPGGLPDIGGSMVLPFLLSRPIHLTMDVVFIIRLV